MKFRGLRLQAVDRCSGLKIFFWAPAKRILSTGLDLGFWVSGFKPLGFTVEKEERVFGRLKHALRSQDITGLDCGLYINPIGFEGLTVYSKPYYTKREMLYSKPPKRILATRAHLTTGLQSRSGCGWCRFQSFVWHARCVCWTSTNPFSSSEYVLTNLVQSHPTAPT